MKRTRYLVCFLVIGLLLFFIPNFVNAAEVKVSRDVYSNTGMKFTFTGLTLDKTHEYEYGLTQTAAQSVEKYYSITQYTDSSATIDISILNEELRKVVDVVDTGYITIKDKTANKLVLQPHKVDLKIPFMQVTNYTVIPNGKDLRNACIEIPSRGRR